MDTEFFKISPQIVWAEEHGCSKNQSTEKANDKSPGYHVDKPNLTRQQKTCETKDEPAYQGPDHNGSNHFEDGCIAW